MKRGGSPGSGASKKIVVGISGGANSAVTAALLKSQGYHVLGVHLQLVDPKTGENKGFASRCCLTKSQADAQEVCRKLDIPLHVVPVASRFNAAVVDGFIHDLLQARQPNPCIPCNVGIRFGSLLEKATELGCEQVATGHHAQIVRDASVGGEATLARLQRAINAQKDQSFFLFGLRQEQLQRLVFPLGGFQDAMIERLAREFDLPASSPDNPQEICFSTGNAHIAFFEARVPQSLRMPGVIKMVDGSVMGEHAGLHAYRIGQKVKLAPHIKEQEKYQVIGFDTPSHAVVIGFENDRFHAELRASRATWVRRMDGLHGMTTTARFAPTQKNALPCRVTHFENGTLRIELEQPAKEMCVGQAVVFYDGDDVLGGAYVDQVGAHKEK